MPANQTTLKHLSTDLHGQDVHTQDLRKRLEEVIGRARHTHQTYYALIEVTASVGDPIDLLSQSGPAPVVYWGERHSDREYAGLGASAVIRVSGPNAIRDATAQANALLDRCVTLGIGKDPIPPRLFAGFAFEHSAPADAIWTGYDDALVILPRLTYVSDAQGSQAFITIEINPQSNLEELLDTLDNSRTVLLPETVTSVPHSLPAVLISDATNDHVQWTDAVESVLSRMCEGNLEKVVLARRVVLSAAQPIPVWSVMRRLRDAATECFHFAFGISSDRLFVGASPERLFRLQGREIEVDCMAGTTERGTDETMDRALADSLLASEKDRLEHYYVLEDSLRRFGDLCTTMNADTTPRVVKLSTLQHLATTVRGQLKPGIGAGDILEQLHPTPAVGGTPRTVALAAIRELEPYSRGWYAGPIGWFERDRAEFAVAIRSSILSGANAYVFAGAGIVPGSVPEAEWQETQNKAQAFLKAVWA